MAHPSRRVTVNCSLCGKEKSIPLCHYERNTTGNFLCSRTCQSKWRCKKVDTVCANCHSSIVAYYFRFKRFENLFCDAKCQGEFSRKRTKVNCSYCGDELEIRPSNTYTKKFCNRDCYGKWRSENLRGKNNPRYTRKIFVSCNYCGKKKRVSPCHAVHNYYCDDLCRTKWRSTCYSGEGNPNWRGGFSPYAPGFNNALREEIKMRDNHACQLCGATEIELAVHHVDYDKQNNSPENLISLCTNSCHSLTNGNREYWTKYFAQVISNQEGATTIPKGSTAQANGAGSARHLLRRRKRDDDIVCSAWQHAAVSSRKRSESCELR